MILFSIETPRFWVETGSRISKKSVGSKIIVHKFIFINFFSQNLLDKKIPLLLLSSKRGTYH